MLVVIATGLESVGASAWCSEFEDVSTVVDDNKRRECCLQPGATLCHGAVKHRTVVLHDDGGRVVWMQIWLGAFQ